MTPTDQFFDERTAQSRVKSIIVSKYFDAWARVMLGSLKKSQAPLGGRIAYIDLFAGPGRYKNGTESTPVLILKKAIQNKELRDHLVTIFSDKDEENLRSLRQAIDKLPDIRLLKYPPQTERVEVGLGVAAIFEKTRLIPTLFFVDPWGYKGLSLSLIHSVVKDWGCECIFFFNYKRINMGLNNRLFKEHMASLFGLDRAENLRQRLIMLSSKERELAIIEELCQALKDLGMTFVLPFRFKDDRGTRTSHHLIFVSKVFKGYEIMKDIMAKECSTIEQGVPSLEYNPIDAGFAQEQPLLFQLAQPIDDLGEMLLVEFAGQTLMMHEVYERHNVGRRFIKRNYKAVLQKLENEEKISVEAHRKNSFADTVRVRFPSRAGER
jgi:three-Cys-motif partner protein